MIPVAWVGIAAGVALAAAGAVIWVQDGKIEARDKTIQTLREDLGKETQARGQWQAQAGSCSASVDRLHNLAAKQAEAAQAAREGAQRARKEADDLVAEILTAPRPAGQDECQAMQKELDDEIDRRHPRK